MNIWPKDCFFILSFSTLILAVSCKKEDVSYSQAKGLTNETLRCVTYTPAQIQALVSELSAVPTFLSGFSASDKVILYNHLNAVPPLYRAELIRLKKKGTFKGISKVFINGGADGMTYFDSSGPTLIKIDAREQESISYSTIHEIGHAVEGMIQRKSGKSNGIWEATLTGLMGEAGAYNRRNPRYETQVRDYAFENYAEFFAESFNNYYCSPESHAFIKSNLPKTYNLLSSVLEKPVFAGNTTLPTPGNPVPNPAPNPEDPESSPSPLTKNPLAGLAATFHMDVLVKFYNAASLKCDLSYSNINSIEEDGDFIFDGIMTKTDGSQLPPVRMHTSYKNSITSDLIGIKGILKTYFPACG